MSHCTLKHELLSPILLMCGYHHCIFSLSSFSRSKKLFFLSGPHQHNNIIASLFLNGYRISSALVQSLILNGALPFHLLTNISEFLCILSPLNAGLFNSRLGNSGLLSVQPNSNSSRFNFQRVGSQCASEPNWLFTSPDFSRMNS